MTTYDIPKSTDNCGSVGYVLKIPPVLKDRLSEQSKQSNVPLRDLVLTAAWEALSGKDYDDCSDNGETPEQAQLYLRIPNEIHDLLRREAYCEGLTIRAVLTRIINQSTTKSAEVHDGLLRGQ